MPRWIEIPTADMTHEEWVAARKNSIGGSDAAAIVGMSEYASPYSVWAEKTGRVVSEDVSQVEAVRLGNDLEDYVAQRFTEKTGLEVYKKNAILKNPNYPWAHANVDRLVAGADEGLECKTTSALSAGKFKNQAYPDNYLVQSTHYLAVTGYKKWHIAVLVLGKAFLTFEVSRDDREISALMDAEKRFWDYVQSGMEPPMCGNDSEVETLKRMYPDGGGGPVELFGRKAMLDQYAHLTAQETDLKKQKQTIKAEIQRDMGTSEVAYAGEYLVTWKSYVERKFDEKALERDHPLLYAQYSSSRPNRRFEVRNNGI